MLWRMTGWMQKGGITRCKLKGRMDKGVHYDVKMKGWMEKVALSCSNYKCGWKRDIMMCKLRGI